MSSSLALLIYTVGIAGLFFLDREKSVRTSRALWLPVIWLCIVASRPLSVWLGISSGTESANQLLDGSPFDRIIFAFLLAAGIIVLMFRTGRTKVILKANWLVLLYFSYCLISVLWSDFPDVAFKRWTKAVGDLVMVLIVVTDAEPVEALRRFLSRTGFILLPASVLLIRYFDNLGRGYDGFTGAAINVGVTTNKNSLGVITFVLSLGALWRVITLMRTKGEPYRGRHLLAQGTLLAFGGALLVIAHSATSGASFALGAGLMLATGLPAIKGRPTAVHALVFGLLLIGCLTLFLGGETDIVHAVGRQSNLTGRTAVWEAVIPMAPNVVLGAGFETFWLGPRLESLWRAFPIFHPNEAHNGYIEIYLNLGWVGLGLIALILINGYRRAVDALRVDPAIGGLMLAYVLAAVIYSGTEAGFRLLNPMWIFFLLVVLMSGSAVWHPLCTPRVPCSGDAALSTAKRQRPPR